MNRPLEIEVRERFQDGVHILEIVDASQPSLPQVPNDRLFGIGERYRRLFGGEWRADFATCELVRIT